MFASVFSTNAYYIKFPTLKMEVDTPKAILFRAFQVLKANNSGKTNISSKVIYAYNPRKNHCKYFDETRFRRVILKI